MWNSNGNASARCRTLRKPDERFCLSATIRLRFETYARMESFSAAGERARRRTSSRRSMITNPIPIGYWLIHGCVLRPQLRLPFALSGYKFVFMGNNHRFALSAGARLYGSELL